VSSGWSTSSGAWSRKTGSITTRRQSVKLLEVLVLLVALALFVWWQLRDVAKAQEESARRRAAQAENPPPATRKESK
jgi:hypothetical protein